MTPPEGDERRTASTRLLTELVNDTLDPGYAAAARRRGPDPPRRWYDAPAVVIGALLVGFVAVLAWVHTNRGAPQAAVVHDRLVQRVRDGEQADDRLARRLDDLQRTVAAARAAALPGSDAGALAGAQLAAGQVAVHGPGVTVTLREPAAATPSAAPTRAGTVPIGSTNILTDRDVRSVVNELWADGAEAVAVNDVRLAPTSSIRFAGQAVLVDFRPVTSPYRIEAIGDADDLSTSFAQSSVASRYQTLVDADGIGFDVTESGRLDLPAATPVTLGGATAGGHR